MPTSSSKRLYMRGLPKRVTADELHKFLSCYGDISEVKILPNCAFVEFESEKDALIVLEMYKNQPLLGKDIVIEIAHPLRKDMASITSLDNFSKLYRPSLSRPRPLRYAVLVSNIPRDIRWQELKDFGRSSGSLVAFCDVGKKGQGFIEYFTYEDARRSALSLDGKYLGTKRVHVTEHQSFVSEAWSCYRSRSQSPERRFTSDPSTDNSNSLRHARLTGKSSFTWPSSNDQKGDYQDGGPKISAPLLGQGNHQKNSSIRPHVGYENIAISSQAFTTWPVRQHKYSEGREVGYSHYTYSRDDWEEREFDWKPLDPYQY